ncbi:MAG TPA: hypothetical protein VFK33_09420 [Bacillales bacterium]|nr:hypothetical protein [Bacillales bacterium]
MAQQAHHMIDTDIHERVVYNELVPYLEQPWKRYITDCHWLPLHTTFRSRCGPGGRKSSRRSASGQ